MFGRKQKAKRVRGGERVRRTCPECGADTTFVEVTVEKSYTAYAIVKLFETESTAYQCSACEEIMALDRTGEPNLSPKEQAAAERARAKAEAERARAQERAEAERREKIRRDAEQLRAEQAARDANIDDELAAMKARLGLD